MSSQHHYERANAELAEAEATSSQEHSMNMAILSQSCAVNSAWKENKMPTVPELPPSKVNKPKTMIVCTRDGKPLSPEDQKALDEYIEFRLKRHEAQPKRLSK